MGKKGLDQCQTGEWMCLLPWLLQLHPGQLMFSSRQQQQHLSCHPYQQTGNSWSRSAECWLRLFYQGTRSAECWLRVFYHGTRLLHYCWALG